MKKRKFKQIEQRIGFSDGEKQALHRRLIELVDEHKRYHYLEEAAVLAACNYLSEIIKLSSTELEQFWYDQEEDEIPL